MYLITQKLFNSTFCFFRFHLKPVKQIHRTQSFTYFTVGVVHIHSKWVLYQLFNFFFIIQSAIAWIYLSQFVIFDMKCLIIHILKTNQKIQY